MSLKGTLIHLANFEPLISRKIVVPVPIDNMRPSGFEDPWTRAYGNLNLPPEDEASYAKWLETYDEGDQ